MRILLIIDWNRGRGGAEAHAALVRQGLMDAGDEVRLLTSSAGTAGDGTADYVAFGTSRTAPQALLQLVNPFAVATVRRAVSAFRPDVVWINMFAHHLSPAVLIATGGLPKVLHVTDYKLICPIGSKLRPDGSLCNEPAGWVCHQSGCLGLSHWLRDQPRYALIRSALRRTDRVLACSRWIQRELAGAHIESELMYLPVPAPPRNFERVPRSEPTFLYCGRLDVEKGVELLIRSFARLCGEFPTAYLRIAGQGPERCDLERLAGSLGVSSRVEFLGWRSLLDLEPLLADAWASVVPSLWAEAQGLVALEAMVRRVPVIASSAGGLGEIVEHEVNGLLFPNQNGQALFDHLRAVATGSAFPEHRLSEEAARCVAEEFGVDEHITRLRRIFTETIQARARTRDRRLPRIGST
jgi:glycosyltransferase involved in cell wall biosynthesis